MVPAYRRNFQPLEVLNAAERMFNEVLRLTNKEKVFPLKKRQSLAQPIIDNCRNLSYALQYANNLRIWHKDQRKIRRQQQFDAMMYLNRAMVDIKFAHDILHIDIGTFQHMIDMSTEVGNKLRAWMKSDLRRVSDFIAANENRALEGKDNIVTEDDETITPGELALEEEFAEGLDVKEKDVIEDEIMRPKKQKKPKVFVRSESDDEFKALINSQMMK